MKSTLEVQKLSEYMYEMVDEYFANKQHQIQETHNNCFGLK